jgi:hypothetical protein
MAALTKTVDGKPLSAEKFAYVGDAQDISTWHLPIDDDHIDSAVKMFGHETHVPESAKATVARKIAATAKKAGIDTKDFEAKHTQTQEHGEAPRGWIEIFRAGDYRGANKGLISRDDLDRVVRNYDPTYHEAPATIGHPADDKPAYGWIEALAVDGDKLLAREKQVDPKFNEARQAGRFKKRSAAFYCDADGKITGLRHVAYLGAQPPEVKGLQDLAFNDHGARFIEVDFGEDETVAAETKTIKEEVKAFFAEMFGGSAQPKTFSEADAQRIATEAATAASAPLVAKVTALETQLTAQTTKFAERETALAGGEVKQRATAAIARLKTAGKWIPAYEKMGLGLIFDELAKLTTTIEFGEGDAKKTVTPLETLTLFMEGLPKIIHSGRFVESAGPGKTKTSTGDPLTDAARARQAEKKITFGEALAQIADEQPELTMAVGASGGAV